jgi:hypothetical protein
MNCGSNCWWCTYEIPNNYLSLPISYDKKLDKFNCIGFFCSWECMKAYNINSFDCNRSHQMSFITQMYQQINKSTLHIQCAPPRQCLKRFGGDLTITEFRSKHNFNYIDLANMILLNPPNIEKSINYKWINKDDAKKEFNKSNSKDTGNPIKMKSPKIKNNASLDKSLNIFPNM